MDSGCRTIREVPGLISYGRGIFFVSVPRPKPTCGNPSPTVPHDQKLRLSAKSVLKFEPIRFTGLQAREIGRGFATAVDESDYQILACSILPDHVHVVVRRHARDVEKIVGHLKSRATQQLVAAALHPFAHLQRADGRFPSVGADRSWKVFLDSEADVARAIEYVRKNPLREGLKEQHWSFVRSIV
jgi:REP element-mobilizing transposase RayT